MLPKFGNFSISMREVIMTSILKGLTQKNQFFRGVVLVQVQQVGNFTRYGLNITFYTSVTKGLNVKVREFWGVIPTFVEVTGEKLVGKVGAFPPTSPHSSL